MTRRPYAGWRWVRRARTLFAAALAAVSFTAPARGSGSGSELVIEDPSAASAALEREASQARSRGDGHALAAALIALSDARIERDELDVAVGSAEEAIAVSHGAADFAQEVFAIIVRGDVDFYRTEFAAARGRYDAALALSREHADHVGEAAALKSIGIVRKYQGEFEESLDDLEEARRLFIAQGDIAGEASALMNLGGTYVLVGDLGRALDAYLPALEMARGLDDWHVHHVLMRLGTLYLEAGSPERALPLLEEASEIVDRHGLTLQRTWALATLSRALAALGRRREAMAVAERALSISASMTESERAARFAGIGWLHLGTDPASSLEWARRGLALGHEAPTGGTWPLHSLMGDALMSLGRLDEAIVEYGVAVDAIESIRSSIASKDFRSTYLQKHLEVYQRLAAGLVQRWERSGRDEDAAGAFEALERGRARALLEALGGSPAEAPRSPGAASVRGGLGPTEALLSYLVGANEVVAFVVTPDRVRPVALRGEPRALGRRAENYVQLLMAGDEETARVIAARLASEVLAPLLSHLPAATDHLIIVPDGVLHLLPFETLPLPGDEPGAPGGARLLLDQYTVSYVPSAGAMLRLDESRSGDPDARRDLLMLAAPALPASIKEDAEAGGSSRGSLAVYAHEGLRIPDLPYSAREAKRVGSIVSGRSEIDLGAEASEARLKRLLPGEFRIVHLAAHGLVSALRPDRSALLLAAGGTDPAGATEDGLLHAFEIRRLRVDCDLVVLSACQTARGRILGGEGEQGLARAFVAAGARSVLASLWSVEDAATASLMESFYAGLASGLPPARALRRAKLELRRSATTPAARDWAAFVLIGHGAAPIRIDGRSWWDPNGRNARAVLAAAGPGALLCGGLLLRAGLRRRLRAG